MARLTINEVASGYTDVIELAPSDFTTAAGNTATIVKVPCKKGDVVEGAALNITEAFSTNTNMRVGINGTAEAFIANKATNTTAATPVADSGSALDDDGNANANKHVFTADGDVEISVAATVGGDSTGKATVLLKIRRTQF